jgi:hypothetical protein
MKKLATTAIIAAMLAGSTGASAVSDASSTTTPERTLHVKRLVLHPIESHKPAPGHYLGVDRLRSLATHKIAAYANWSGVRNPKTHRIPFWMAISLKGGLIDTAFNPPPDVQNFTGRITHGYGKYRGIKGTIKVRHSDTGRVVYILRYRL